MYDSENRSTHTPGPWMSASEPSSVVGWPVVAAGGRSICSLSWLGKKPDHVTEEQFVAYRTEVRANGHLIAAAPDLLEALQAMTEGLPELLEDIGYTDEEDMLGKAARAIAKALGACVNHPDRRSITNLDNEELCQECADAWVRGEGAHAAWLDAEEGKAR